MRGLGRLILDLRGTDTEVVTSGGRDYTVRRAPSTPEGVRQVLLELPPLRFDDAELPEPFGGFTAVAVPNPHVIAVVEEYSEPDLIDLGKRADEVFAEGANVSFLQPLGGSRPGAPEPLNPRPSGQPRRTLAPPGLCPHVRARRGPDPVLRLGCRRVPRRVLELTGLDPAQRLVVRNAGGVAAASIQVRDGAWYPVLEGNATVVYRPRPTRRATRRARWNGRPRRTPRTRPWTRATPLTSKATEFKPRTPSRAASPNTADKRETFPRMMDSVAHDWPCGAVKLP